MSSRDARLAIRKVILLVTLQSHWQIDPHLLRISSDHLEPTCPNYRMIKLRPLFYQLYIIYNNIYNEALK